MFPAEGKVRFSQHHQTEIQLTQWKIYVQFIMITSAQRLQPMTGMQQCPTTSKKTTITINEGKKEPS